MSEMLTVAGFNPDDVVAEARVAEFRRVFPDVELRFVDEGPLDDAAFLAGVAAGDAPDLAYVDRDLIGALAARGAIVPIDEWVAREEVDLHQFRDTAIRHASFRGTMYGLPELYDVHVLFIHVAALAAAMLVPTDIEFGDWVRLPRANRAMTYGTPTGIGRAGVDPGLPDLLPVWAKANGADLLSADGRTAQFDDPRVLEALEAATVLIDDHGGWPAVEKHRDDLDLFGPNHPFIRDQFGVMPLEASYLDVLAEETPYLEVLVKPLVDRHALPLTYSHGMAWAIANGARNSGGAFSFARVMTSPDAWVAGAQARRAATQAAGKRFEAFYTANKVADHAIWTTVWEPSGNLVWDQAAHVIRSIQETGFIVPPNAAPREVRAAWIAGTRHALRGDQGPARALKQANRRAQAALDAAG
jgi:multiple sugar transport system substrate-binding protein